MRILNILLSSALLLFLFAISACGGGGGGGGGSGRTTETAVRIIHASLDGAPLVARIGAENVISSGYIEVTDYLQVDEGQTQIVVERAHVPSGFLKTVSADLQANTEYSLFVYGEAGAGEWAVRLLEEPVERPDAGFARVQLLNGLQDSSALDMTGAGVSVGPVAFGSSSGFVEAPSGPQVFSVRNRAGQQVASFDLELVDRGEVTFLVAGSDELGLRFKRVYPDLD